MAEEIKVGGIIDMVGARFEMVARMGALPADTVFFRTRMPPGKLVPLHSHIDPECFYVLEGCLEVFLVDEAPKWHAIQMGQSLLVADGIKHAVRNPGETAADLILATNNRFASFLGKAGHLVTADAPFVPPSSDDIQHMLQVSRAYGYWNASPAESATITG